MKPVLVVGSRRLIPPDILQAYCKPLVFRRSNPHRQVSLTSQRRQRSQQREVELLGEKWPTNLAESSDFHASFRDLLHAVNLRHGTDGFTSPPKEGVLRFFSPWKIRRLRPGSNPRTWVPKVSTLPLDHRSRATCAKFGWAGVWHVFRSEWSASRRWFVAIA